MGYVVYTHYELNLNGLKVKGLGVIFNRAQRY